MWCQSTCCPVVFLFALRVQPSVAERAPQGPRRLIPRVGGVVPEAGQLGQHLLSATESTESRGQSRTGRDLWTSLSSFHMSLSVIPPLQQTTAQKNCNHSLIKAAERQTLIHSSITDSSLGPRVFSASSRGEKRDILLMGGQRSDLQFMSITSAASDRFYGHAEKLVWIPAFIWNRKSLFLRCPSFLLLNRLNSKPQKPAHPHLVCSFL